MTKFVEFAILFSEHKYDMLNKKNFSSEISMEGKTTIKYLQNYIMSKDYNPKAAKDYFLKLSEEVGELSRAIRKVSLRSQFETVKETIDEEIWDVMYYCIALANCYGIDLEQTIKDKEAINNLKYNTNIKFEESK